MAQLKAHEVDAWLKRPSAATVIVLLYGPDRGLVSERAADFAARTGIPLDDPFSVVRLDAAELDAGRLIDEARTLSLFGGRRLVWVRHASAQKALADAVKDLAQAPPVDAFVLIEADELKKSAPLRAAVETSACAMALPCYVDEARALDALIDEVFSAARLRIDADARRMLRQRLGADRLASRGELEKLALYALGRGQITIEDIDGLTGDVAQSSMDGVIDRMLEADAEALDDAFERYVAGGGTSHPVLAAALRQLQQLQLMRAAMDRSGSNAGQAVASARPPVFFSRRRLLEQVLQRLDAQRITTALARLNAAILQTRRSAALAPAITQRVLSGICLELARR